MTIVQVELDVCCQECNRSLAARVVNGVVYVVPCVKCLSFANRVGYREGKEAARDAAGGGDE
jgi:hypothetical protein